ncbi:MAG: hypothetical protein LPK19_00110 [Hymenobacteraceae bacterium]|nr:hypothetical protein [Hymenobacteraceae bacterium]MDX5394575.1 hypothetical protein [Hymenobacteraceae bacterium]MDX5510596.1 hypothetical protein [Hymenobacteraceae bacterium]
MNSQLQTLTRLLHLLQNSSITDYDYQQNILRLQLEHPLAHRHHPDNNVLNLVLEGCRQLYFNTYLNRAQDRTIIAPDVIFDKGLIVQGATASLPNKLTLYCTSFKHAIEAGELHLLFNQHFHFTFYDQEYEKLNWQELFPEFE